MSGPASALLFKMKNKQTGGPVPGVSDLATRQQQDPVEHQQHNEPLAPIASEHRLRGGKAAAAEH